MKEDKWLTKISKQCDEMIETLDKMMTGENMEVIEDILSKWKKEKIIQN